jgi:hypothetical protein
MLGDSHFCMRPPFPILKTIFKNVIGFHYIYNMLSSIKKKFNHSRFQNFKKIKSSGFLVKPILINGSNNLVIKK